MNSDWISPAISATSALIAWLQVDRNARVLRDSETRKSAQERKALASALLGEINAFVTNFDFPQSLANLEKIHQAPIETVRPLLRAYPIAIVTSPVFDRCCDRIGILPGNLSQQLSGLYNFITAVRLMLAHLGTPSFAEGPELYIRIFLQQTIHAAGRAGKLYGEVVEPLRAAADAEV